MIILLAIIIFCVMVYEGTKQVERANAEVRREFGERYNPDVAGQWWHAIVIAILVIVLTLVLVSAAGTIAMGG